MFRPEGSSSGGGGGGGGGKEYKGRVVGAFMFCTTFTYDGLPGRNMLQTAVKTDIVFIIDVVVFVRVVL
jgi:hypothetical protein